MIEGLWLSVDPNACVETPRLTVIATAEVPWLGYVLLLYFPPSLTLENPVTSSNDITIICSINLAGKPLHMCRRTAIIHLCICQHPLPNKPKMMEIPNLFVSFLNPVLCL